MFSGITLASLSGAVISIAEQIGKVILHFMAIVAICSVLYPILPNDPFRASINNISSFFSGYSNIINTFIPVKFIVSSMLFAVATKYFLWLYKRTIKAVTDDNADDFVNV